MVLFDATTTRGTLKKHFNLCYRNATNGLFSLESDQVGQTARPDPYCEIPINKRGVNTEKQISKLVHSPEKQKG